MAVVHKKVTENHFGEVQLAKLLAALPDDHLHLWFSVDCIPGVTDIDILILHEYAGFFTIEVKAVPFKAITYVTRTKVGIRGREVDRAPWMQALTAQERLREFLGPRLKKRCPFIVPTACFPKIDRNTWNKSLDNAEFKDEFSKRLLFSDDVENTAEVFKRRLEHIFQNSPVRSGSNYPFRMSEDLVEQINSVVMPHARPKVVLSDYKKLKQIEERVSKQEVTRIEPLSKHREVFWGYPGTGKTFRLLEIGMYHAFNGVDCMFLCFNKALAADIRRMIHASERLKLAKGRFEVYDIFDLAKHYSLALDVPIPNDVDHDEWGRTITDFIEEMAEDCIDFFGTVLVDEAQDMNDWQLRLATLQVEKNGCLVIASGNGQELYDHGGAQGSTKDRFEGDGFRLTQLRRNFRNFREGYLLAHCFNNYYPKADKINLDKISGKQNKEFQFDRVRGRGYKIKYINDSELPPPSDPMHSYAIDDLMVTEYAEIIESELDGLADQDQPIDLLILVPSQSHLTTKWARSALQKLQESRHIDYTDLVEETHRRDVPKTEAVRLCTYHSSRGLEGVRVIVFGAEGMEMLCEATSTPVKNLTFVVFSRALFETTIVLRSGIRNEMTNFLGYASSAVQDVVKYEESTQAGLDI